MFKVCFLSYAQSQAETLGRLTIQGSSKVMFFSYWNINVGPGARVGRGGLRETGERAAAQSLLCDLKLSKSSSEAYPTCKTKALQVSDSPFPEAVNHHLLLTKHGPWCDLTSSPQERSYMAQLPLPGNSSFMPLNPYSLAGLWQTPTATFPLYK